MQAGDVIIALPSSGIHSNGYSLVRKVFDVENADLTVYEESLGKTLGEELLTPTKIYVKPVLQAVKNAEIHGISHITGGGFYENIPRAIPDGLCAEIDKKRIKIPPIFTLIRQRGNIPERDMFNTFNMGVGMAVIASEGTAQKAIDTLKAAGENPYIIGKIIAGEEKIKFI